MRVLLGILLLMLSLSLMPFEKEFVQCPSMFLTLLGGRGCGKSHAIAARMKWLTTRYPGFRYLYVTPLAVQGQEVYNQMAGDPDFHRFVRKCRERPYPKIKLKNGSQIWFRSCRIWDSIRSTGEHEICLDESQDHSVVEEKVEQVLLPMLGRMISPAGGRGRFVLAGQFRGADWRYEKYWVKGQPKVFKNTDLPDLENKPNAKSQRPLYMSWRVPSWEGYAYKTEGGKETLALMKDIMMPEVWDQEWAAIPRSNANAVFKEYDVDNAGIYRKPQISPEEKASRSGKYALIVDPGGIVDPTKVLVLHSSGEFVFAKAFPLGMDDVQCGRECAEIAFKFRARMFIDATGGGGGGKTEVHDERIKKFHEQARSMNIVFRPMYFQGQNKQRLITNARIAIRDGFIGFAHTLYDVFKELKAFEYVFDEKSRTYKYSAPKKQHDDYVSCVLLGVEVLHLKYLSERTADIGAFA